MASSNRQLRCTDYHVAWICPVADVELLPARLMLDEEHSTPPYNTHYDENTYVCGTINGHAVVISTCPLGETGNLNAGRLTGSMFKTFPNIRMAVLVGIGGGIPRATASENALDDIHLGDVVVGWPGDGKPACVYHNRGRSKVDGEFEMVGTMQNPEWRLLQALSILASDHEMGKPTFADQLKRLQKYKKLAHPGLDHDRLFRAAYHHIGDYRSNCVACDQNELVQRPARTEDDKRSFIFHRGRIATGNSVIQDGELRDQIGARCDGALCVEMEAAGVDVNKRCLVIRGISDYADSHKNDVWKSHAAGNAAAFARELLCRIQPDVVKDMEGVSEAPWVIPFIRPPSFAGREPQLAQLSAHISAEGGRRLAIYGLGGCGKTALALESAYRTREQQPKRAVFWVAAVSLESFEQGYREIGTLLRIPGIADAKADVKRLVKARLSDEGSGQWLMVVDNADDVGVLFGQLDEESGGNRLIDNLPYSRKGSIVFTTRTRVAAVKLAESKVIALGELDKVEATELLKTRLFQEHQRQLRDEETVDEFLDILAFLALAIVQAVAFVNTNDITLSDYISCYKASEQEATKLLSKEFEDQGRYREMKNPMATTWYVSFEQIRKHNELAAGHLSFMACTANNDIPASMLPANGSQVQQTEAIGTLKAYAFIAERQPRTDAQQEQTQRLARAFDVHPLVHLAMRGWLKAHNQWNLWAEKTLTRLVEIVPFGDHDTREAWTTYLPHAMHVVDVPEVYDTEGRMSLLDRIGRCEQTLGRYRDAELAHQRLLEQREEVLGKEHPDTLRSMNNVAGALQNQGKYTEAEKMHQGTLVMRGMVLGTEHPHTLASMSNLAGALSSQGKYAEAEKMHRKTLVMREKVLGKEHPHTLASMSNLAWALRRQGKYAEVEKMDRKILALKEKVSGKEHLHTLMSMNVARVLSNQGKYVEAEKMHRKTLAMREEMLGKEHPDTLASMNEVALALSDQEKYTEAEKLHRETLAMRKEVLGKEHPHTLMSINNVARALNNQGEYTEAEKMDREILAMREKVLGKEHPDTLVSMSNLAGALSSQGKYAGAEKMHREILAIRIKVLGKEHPHTLMSMGSVAWALSGQEKYTEAEKMQQETLVMREEALGKEHPDTLASMNEVAMALGRREKYTEAEKVHRETLAMRKEVLGKEHLDTLASMNEVALALGCQEKYTEAEKVHRETLAIREKVLGKEHPDTLMSMNSLARALNSQKEYAKAEKMHRETLTIREKVLGKEHPDTLASMSNLAGALSSQGKYAGAEKMHRETLAVKEKVLGKEDPHTLISMGSLARALSSQRKYAEAEKMDRETLVIREKVLGKEHPDTLMSMDHVAWALGRQGKYMEAEKIDRETLTMREKVLGKEHPHTLASMNKVALALGRQEKYTEAEKLHRETLAMREEVLGKEHPDTLTSMNNLARALKDKGEYIKAEKMHRETLAMREKVLGKEHPDTLMSINNLAWALSSQRKYAEAEKMHRETLAMREKVLGKEHPRTLMSMKNVARAVNNQRECTKAEKMDRESWR
ncbi:TPR-like protein [Lophiostoma macrostomum CBS 122681]|uniref:TPR-like protein n=1 Tax=Lophiostoma macrostomum CBS 122681 TaxID=1314788 RepID=A0A6A6SM09_9PLEO|nr:TPR-like protein [Lophiostoma macrostomum CBS 122681]